MYKSRTQSVTGGTYTPLTLSNYGNVVVQNNLTASSANINGDEFITSSRTVLRGTLPTENSSGVTHANKDGTQFLNASGNDSETWAEQNG